MSAILSALSAVDWATAGAILAGFFGVIFGWARHKSAQTAEARADQKVTRMEGEVAAANAQVAQASVKAVSNANAARRDANALPASELDEALRREGALRE